MLSRRDLLARSTLLALAPTVPGFLARTARAAAPARDATVLVVVQLDGGNDGINTVVPFKDEGYARHRTTLRLPADRLLKFKEVGLHPALTDMAPLLEKGRLAVVQGVGYPNPSRSHFESMAVWHSARRDKAEHGSLGWLGRAFDGPRDAPASVYVGVGELPVALRGRRAIASGLTRPEDFVLDPTADGRHLLPGAAPGDDLTAFVRRHALDAYVTADRMAEALKGGRDGSAYPTTDLAGHLQTVARLIKAGTGTRVFYARQSGYDTHAGQSSVHSRLLRELSGALAAFLKDLELARLAERVAVLCFSEFGRTVKENGSAGTDHGTAAPVFLLGARVKGGLVGATPSLTDLDPRHGDLRMGLDFRRVYAAVLEGWLGLPSRDVLGGTFAPLDLFARR
jgi:uncharacterized protein (DUF1501 family)